MNTRASEADNQWALNARCVGFEKNVKYISVIQRRKTILKFLQTTANTRSCDTHSELLSELAHAERS